MPCKSLPFGAIWHKIRPCGVLPQGSVRGQSGRFAWLSYRDGAETSRKTGLEIAWFPCYHTDMIQSFKNTGTEDIFNGENTRAARKTCPESLWQVAGRKLDQLDSVVSFDELRVPPGNQLEALSGDRKGQHSIRINKQYRVCFTWTDLGPAEVEVVDYH